MSGVSAMQAWGQRGSRMVLAAIVAIGMLLASAGLAHAAATGLTGTTLAVSASSTQAGGNPTITSTLGFTYASGSTDTVKDATVALPPGMLVLPPATGATGVCTAADLTAKACPAASLIGTGTLTDTPASLSLSINLYLMPATGTSDIAGIGAIISNSGLTGSTVVATSAGSIVMTTNRAGAPQEAIGLGGLPQTIPVSIVGISLPVTQPVQTTGLSLVFNAQTAAKTAFTREPATCAAGTASAAIDTYAANTAGTATGAVAAPTGCSSLHFAPALAVEAAKSTAGGVALIAATAQAAGQSPPKTLTLTLPAALQPNTTEFTSALCASATYANCTPVGAASLVTPLASAAVAAPVYLTGSATAPVLAVVFPAPYGFTVTAPLGAASGQVTATFGNLPDLPSTAFALAFTGGASGIFTSSCNPATGTATASLTSQSGASAAPTAAVSIATCTAPGTTTTPTPVQYGPPKLVSKSLTGLAKGKATLKLKVAAVNSSAPKLDAAAVALPSGVSFVKKNLKKYVSIGGGKLKAVALVGSKLIITLKAPVTSFSVKVTAKGLSVTKALQKKVTKHKVKTERLTIVAVSASNAATVFKPTVKV
jgi:hypothetical protein